VERESIRRWLAGYRAAEARSLEEKRRAGPLAPAVAFEQAMELIDMISDERPDPVREREVAVARSIWVRLKSWAARRA
jgi:hypothetical protein